MPASIPKAAKAKEVAIKKEEAIQRAVEEFQQNLGLPSALSHGLLAKKHGIARLTLQAQIKSAGQQQKICPDEEQLLVDYLQETAHQGFPDMLKGQPIVQMRSYICNLVILVLQLVSIGLIGS